MYFYKFKLTVTPIIFASIAWILASTATYAASSAWLDLGGGKVRLLAVLDPNTKKVTGGIEVKLEDGWSTYWRNPGSVGIAPNLDLSKSSQLNDVKFYHPTPLLVKNPLGSYAGYKKSVTFLFEGELQNAQLANIKSDIFIGLCSEICIPAQASLEIKGSELLQYDPLISQHLFISKFKLPKVEASSEVVDDVKLKDDKTLLVQFKQSTKAENIDLFVEGPEEWYLTAGKLIAHDEIQATFEVDVSRAPEGTDILSQKLRYTLVSDGKSIETIR